jgi:hypothetical protein
LSTELHVTPPVPVSHPVDPYEPTVSDHLVLVQSKVIVEGANIFTNPYYGISFVVMN